MSQHIPVPIPARRTRTVVDEALPAAVHDDEDVLESLGVAAAGYGERAPGVAEPELLLCLLQQLSERRRVQARRGHHEPPPLRLRGVRAAHDVHRQAPVRHPRGRAPGHRLLLPRRRRLQQPPVRAIPLRRRLLLAAAYLVLMIRGAGRRAAGPAGVVGRCSGSGGACGLPATDHLPDRDDLPEARGRFRGGLTRRGSTLLPFRQSAAGRAAYHLSHEGGPHPRFPLP